MGFADNEEVLLTHFLAQTRYGTATQHIPHSSRRDPPTVRLVSADLFHPKKMVQRLEALHVEDEVHCLIHSGAMVLHMRPYENLRTANVTASLELARFCRQYGVAMHHVSTGLTPDYEEVSPTDFEISAAELIPSVRRQLRPYLQELAFQGGPSCCARVDLAPPAARELGQGYTLSKWAAEYAVRLVHK